MNAKTLIKKILFTIAFPVIMFLVMLIITSANGKPYANEFLVTYLTKYASLSTIMALAIFSQFRNGRFDFSGGAIVVLTSIIAGNIAHNANDNIFLYFVLCIGVSLILNMIVATVYCLARVPIIIITIAMALVYEACTYLVFNAEGVYISSSKMGALFNSAPGIFIPTILAVLVFVGFTYFTIWGKQAQMLSNNQKVACNIGINEIKNVYATYVVTGILLGLGSVIYGVADKVTPQASLSTSGVLFAYIVPVFMGMYFGSQSYDFIGIIVSSIGLGFLNHGLNCLGVGAGGYQQIIFGIFTLFIYSLSTQGAKIKAAVSKIGQLFGGKKNVKSQG